MSIEFRHLRESEREECIRLWTTVFSSDGDAFFRRYLYSDVDWIPEYTQVAVVDGRLASAVQVCKRSVTFPAIRLTMGGIANVATLQEARGQGLASECLRRAIAVMEADAFDFSLLFTGLDGFYAREGYEAVAGARFVGRIPERVPARVGGLETRPATESDQVRIRGLYDRFNRRRPYTVVRSEAYWREWIRPSGETVVAVAPNGEVVGYAVLRLPDKPGPDAVASIAEHAVEPVGEASAEETTAALVGACVERAQAAGAGVFRHSGAAEPAIHAALRLAGIEAELMDVRGGMMRVLSREGLFRDLSIGWNDSWRAAGSPTGELVFATPYGETAVRATRAGLQVGEPEGAATAVPQASLFRWMGEGAGPSVGDTATGFPGELARALFPSPVDRPAYYGADGF